MMSEEPTDQELREIEREDSQRSLRIVVFLSPSSRALEYMSQRASMQDGGRFRTHTVPASTRPVTVTRIRGLARGISMTQGLAFICIIPCA